MIKDAISRYNKPLKPTNEFCLLYLRFVCNFNEALLSAEFVQSFFKFLGINIWSSTLIWGIPPILIVIFGPFFRNNFLNKKYDTFLNNMILLSCLFFLNSLGFISLFNLETYTANQFEVTRIMLILSGVAFTSIDFTKFLYEDQIFGYMSNYVDSNRKTKFKYLGIIFEKLGRMFGAFISCLYVVLQRTHHLRFSDDFLTNMQFTYYFGICFNTLTVFFIFLFWPKNFNIEYKPILHNATSTIDYYFPGIAYIKDLQKNNKRILIRHFFISGMYWFVCVTITQWVSNKFMEDYPDNIQNSVIQAVDVGTAWGAVGLTLFYLLWGLSHIITNPFKIQLMKYSKMITRVLNFYGGVMFFLSYYLYDKNLKYMIICMGLTGIAYDWVLIEKITDKIKDDLSIVQEDDKIKKFKVRTIVGLVDFMSELTFFIIIPCILNEVSDRNQMLIFSITYFLLSFSVPFEKNHPTI